MAPQELVTLVRSSNNIAWKNLNIAEDADETSSVTVGPTPDGSPAALTFTDPALAGSPGSVFNWGSISVDLGLELFDRWVDGGMLGGGIKSISATTVTLGDSGGVLYNIELEDEDLFTVKVSWTPKAPASAPRRGGLDIYHLDVTEWTQWRTYFPKAFGGVRLVKKTTAPLP